MNPTNLNVLLLLGRCLRIENSGYPTTVVRLVPSFSVVFTNEGSRIVRESMLFECPITSGTFSKSWITCYSAVVRLVTFL